MTVSKKARMAAVSLLWYMQWKEVLGHRSLPESSHKQTRVPGAAGPCCVMVRVLFMLVPAPVAAGHNSIPSTVLSPEGLANTPKC